MQSDTTMEEQFNSIMSFLKARFDGYIQVYNGNPKTLWSFMNKMDGCVENFSLRSHMGPLKIYGPTKQRLTFEALRLGRVPEEFIEEKRQEWNNNYKANCEIMNNYLNHYFGIGYKDSVRSDVPLRILKH